MQIFPDPTIGGMSGHLAGSNYVDFTKTSGVFARRWVLPTNPKSAQQTLIRGFQSISSKLWNTLTKAQTTPWDTYASTYYTVLINGTATRPSAFQVFVKINNWRQIMGESTSITPPTTAPPSPLVSATPIASATDAPAFTVTHGISVVTNYKVGLQITPATAAPSNRPLAKDLRYIAGLGADSFVALPASGSNATFDSPSTTWADADRFGYTLIVASPEFVFSSPIGGDAIYTEV